jgi:hypothetical protein
LKSAKVKLHEQNQELENDYNAKISNLQQLKQALKSDIDFFSLHFSQLQKTYSEDQKTSSDSEASLKGNAANLQLEIEKLKAKVDSNEIENGLKNANIDELKIKLTDLQIKYDQAMNDNSKDR